MGERPEAVRIDDLLDPVLPPEVAGAVEAMAPLAAEVSWSADAVLDEAAAATGLSDFGPDLFREPLDVLLNAFATEAPLSTLGVLSNHATLVQSAANRLLLVDYLKRHPEARDVEIERPIIIAGQARTGTTHLHNLMAADTGLRSLPYWESVEPLPPLAEQSLAPASDAEDPRYQRTAEKLAGLNHVLPYFKRMHDMYPEHVHEEIQLLANSFSTMLFETSAPMPSWRDWYLRTDQTPFYAEMKVWLQVLSHRDGVAKRWLLKSPQHVEQLDPLFTVFPDASVVCTHRDPVAANASMANMVTYTSRTSLRPEAMIDVARYWIERGETMCRHHVEQRDGLASDRRNRVFDVRFADFMADDVAMVERIYGFADEPFTEETRRALEAFMVEHPRGKHGGVRYDIADFGFDPAERRTALQFYLDRFDL